MDLRQTIFGPILNPRADGTVDFLPDGAMSCDERGIIEYVGPRAARAASLGSGESGRTAPSRKSNGIILPPFLDAHIHVPQHPIRGHFMDGVEENPKEGRLLAGLNRNVFPAEAKCADTSVSEKIVHDFARETIKQGVIGGAAYMTVHHAATDLALSTLSDFWSAGLVLMEMNCPQYLRVDPLRVEAQMRELAERFGKRFIVTDRFAVTVGSKMRRAASRIAGEFNLRTQTHLNEQLSEKRFVEKQLYPDATSYTDVYRRDGLLDHRPILAHCIHMTADEWDLVAETRSVVAHCPTSNTLLCSGVMPLDEVKSRGIEYAICTDVGASPTTSILAEMAQFLKVHAGRSKHATPSEALYRATLAPAKILDLNDRLGSFEIGKPMSFIEAACDGRVFASADDAILRGLLDLQLDDSLAPAFDRLAAYRLDVGPDLDLLERDVRQTAERLEQKVISVTRAGEKIV